MIRFLLRSGYPISHSVTHVNNKRSKFIHIAVIYLISNKAALRLRFHPVSCGTIIPKFGENDSKCLLNEFPNDSYLRASPS